MKYILFFAFIVWHRAKLNQPEPIKRIFEEKIYVWDGTERKPTVTDETGERVGTFLPIYYQESVSTDNWTTLDTIHIQGGF